MKYDVIIAGSGLGGLECGAILSKEGFSVCILEKNELFGGCLQTYRRQRYMLDTGIHYIGSLDEGQVLNQYFKYMGIMDKLELQRLDDQFDQILMNDKVYYYTMGHDAFVEQFCEQFPKERENLKKYAVELQKVGNQISIEKLKKGIVSERGMNYFLLSAHDYLSELVPNRELQRVLAATSIQYGGKADASTFYHHAMTNNSYIESAYRTVGGAMQIADRLVDVIKSNGGEVLNKKEITRFVAQGDEVKAVEVNNEEIIEAKYYISNIHPRRTLELMDKNSAIKNAYVSRIKSLPNTLGVFTLYLCLKENSYPYVNKNIYIHKNGNSWYNSKEEGVNHILISFQRLPETDFTDVVTVLVPMDFSFVKQWENTTVSNRGEDYQQFKEQYSQKILDLLKENGFDFNKDIQKMYSTTPLSYRDYTGTVDGSAYGILKDYKKPHIGFVSAKTKLKNFFFTGQNMNVHGVLGVTLTSAYTCAELIGEDYLTKKIAYA